MNPKPPEKTPSKVTCCPGPGHWNEMNRKQRRETIRKIQSDDLSLEVVYRDAAGIDIGNQSHYVAVPTTLTCLTPWHRRPESTYGRKRIKHSRELSV
jgi:hypothetical protein